MFFQTVNPLIGPTDATLQPHIRFFLTKSSLTQTHQQLNFVRSAGTPELMFST